MIAACIKWLPASEGISPADQAALELALRHAGHTARQVTVIGCGPPAARRALIDAVACGAHHAVHVVTPDQLDSWTVARALAAHLHDADTVWCGDMSADRGSGSVPAFLAELLGVQQALGLVHLDITSSPIHAVRRMDGGRRERLAITGPAVLSVEGSAAALRRAGLRQTLGAGSVTITEVPGPRSGHVEPPLVPYRPRARQLAAPPGADALARVGALLHSGAPARRGEMVSLNAPDAAARIMQSLRTWGYLQEIDRP